MKRSAARTMAMQMLYEAELGGAGGTATLGLVKADLSDAENMEYIHSTIRGVLDARQELDARIARFAQGWTVARMPKVDLCILRLAVYEMLSGLPSGVAINEAMELAHAFSSDEASTFINGVLGNIARASNKKPETEV